MIKLIILPALFGMWFAEFTMIPQRIAIKLFKTAYLKPFTCGLCFSFWVTLITNFAYHSCITDSILNAGTGSLIAVMIKGTYDAINRR